MADAVDENEPATEADKDVWKSAERRFTTKRYSEYFDPCQDFADASIKCMRRNNSDKEMCQDYFKAYRDCKKEWTLRRKEAKKAARKAAGGSWFG